MNSHAKQGPETYEIANSEKLQKCSGEASFPGPLIVTVRLWMVGTRLADSKVNSIPSPIFDQSTCAKLSDCLHYTILLPS